ncbi:MAG: hypothetical protein KBD60_02160 [Sterolibacterium sp.]|nr:hypothetical protein [Sterolibacterium sp.]
MNTHFFRFQWFPARAVWIGRIGWMGQIGQVFAGLSLMLAVTTVSALPQAAVSTPPASKNAVVKKFATDPVLRQGMTKIASLLESLSNAAQGSVQASTAAGLAGQVEAEVANIIKNCKLEPRADHALHEILLDINQSVLLLRNNKPGIQHSGRQALAQALRNYARYFDHPGWGDPR